MRPLSFPAAISSGQQQYENILQNADLSVPVFEQSVKDDILLDKLRNLVTGSAMVTEAEVRQEFEKQNTKVKFDYAVLRKDDLLKQIHPSEAELKAFYDRNKATYNNSIPEKRKVQYVVLDTAKIMPKSACLAQDLAGLLRSAPRRLPGAGAGQREPHSDQDSAARPGWQS